MDYHPAIVVACHNRPESVSRLLRSLTRAQLAREAVLVLSVDPSGQDDVVGIARDFVWPHGPKKIIVHERHLGLREHILRCGDLSEVHGGVILFEDDLYAGPFFDSYVTAAASFYGQDERIAGVSLYSHRYDETAALRWTPYDDGTDVFFLQLPSSWGQYWSANQWRRFRAWYAQQTAPMATTDALPSDVIRWPETSWKKYFIKYMMETDRYFVYPRLSHSTNFVDPGVHHRWPRTSFQAPLQNFAKEHYRLVTLADSASVYDAHCEMLPAALKKVCPGLRAVDFAVDLYGSKSVETLREPFLLTCRRGLAPLRRYARALKPHEMNVILDVPGDDLFLHETGRCAREYARHDHDRLSYYYDAPPAILQAVAKGTLA